jgi:AcrR family transcriptional regulator
MPRPKRKKGEKSVPDRLEDTFFEMLEEMPYGDITISQLSKRTNVNHNTFYYYFDNIESLVSIVIENTLISDMPAFLMSSLTNNTFGFPPEFDEDDLNRRFKRIRLLVGENSTNWIINSLKDSLLDIWLKAIGVHEAQLSIEHGLLLHYGIGGLFSVIGKYGKDLDAMEFNSLVQSDVVRMLVASMKKIQSEI